MHVAIIMDGNGRWAQERGMSRSEGHRAGGEALRQIILSIPHAGIKTLTLFGFSQENWKRPSDEVTFLMHLMIEYATEYAQDGLKLLREHDVRIRFLGNIDALNAPVRLAFRNLEQKTSTHSSFLLQMAINYSGQADIAQAAERYAEDRLLQGSSPKKSFSDYLMTADSPDPDILIRTGHEMRVSNFLLWPLAYAELFFLEKYWPDFREKDLQEVVQAYHKRQRRHGGLNPATIVQQSAA